MFMMDSLRKVRPAKLRLMHRTIHEKGQLKYSYQLRPIYHLASSAFQSSHHNVIAKAHTSYRS